MKKAPIKLKDLLITESMSVYIKGFDYSKRLDNLLDVIHALLYPVLDKVFETLPADQKAYFQKNRVPEIFAPDGNDYDKPTGTINFYTSGFVKAASLKILRGMLRLLKMKGFVVGPLKGEMSGMYKSQVIRIPITKNPFIDYKGPPEINWAGRNAFHVFKELLGIDPDDSSGSSFHFTPQEIIQRIEMLRKHDPGWVKKSAIPPKTWIAKPPTEPGDEWKEEPKEPSENPYDDIAYKVLGGLGGAKHIDLGLPEETLWRKIGELEELAKWAVEHGFTEMYVT